MPASGNGSGVGAAMDLARANVMHATKRLQRSIIRPHRRAVREGAHCVVECSL
eukprot:CAMPEP_0115835734 /NCGR_PEP_ID=MMETSP0287-20121206/4346_1 /TAXON_ID=412157 /ORGANISM="Chrysochromulina rotalis, Strain UIO044" /LENGTH=52 /DNA_ID=CAMNT_0003289199 /DNA_START=669 /DNA_END=827 /DNA_ORIENTATION=+